MSAISWISVDEWILRIKDSAMLEWIEGVKPNPTQWEGEGMFLINPLKQKMIRGTPAHLQSFVVALFLVPDIRVRYFTSKLDELNSVGLIELSSNRGQMVAPNHQR